VEEDKIQEKTKPQKKVIKFGSSVAFKNDKKSERSNIK
jgi:transcription elongation GreA/GreB family factor